MKGQIPKKVDKDGVKLVNASQTAPNFQDNSEEQQIKNMLI